MAAGGSHVVVTHEESGNVQEVFPRRIVAFDEGVFTDCAMATWSPWPAEVAVEILEWECLQGMWGEPEVCPSPVPEPTVTAVPWTDDGWVDGYVSVKVTGATTTPHGNQDRGVIFSIDGQYGDRCRVSVFVRHRNLNNRASIQVKALQRESEDDWCWNETHIFDAEPALDGVYLMAWTNEGGATTVALTAPGGEWELALPFDNIIAFNQATMGAGDCPYPDFTARTTAEIQG